MMFSTCRRFCIHPYDVGGNDDSRILCWRAGTAHVGDVAVQAAANPAQIILIVIVILVALDLGLLVATMASFERARLIGDE